MKKILIIDFDGTIIDSNYAKQSVLINFIKENYSFDILKEISIFDSQKLTRYELISLAKNSEILNKEREKIDKQIYECVIKSKIDPILYDLFKYCSKNKIKIILVSNTPHKSLQMVVNFLDIAHYFYKIIGKKKAVNKKDIFSDILRNENVKPYEILSVGDNIEDFFASKWNNIPFHGIYSDSLLIMKGKIPISNSLKGVFSSLN